ncbi:MAG: hypothetical protein ACLFTI_11885 [Anaerolineales bacterium]
MASKAFCPACDEAITIQGNPKVGQRLRCPSCDTEIEVIDVNPVELDWAYEDEDDFYEDWDDEDSDEDDDWDDDDWDDDWDDED